MINIPTEWAKTPRQSNPKATVAVAHAAPARQSNELGSYRQAASRRTGRADRNTKGPKVSLVDIAIAFTWTGLIAAILV